MKHLKLTFLIIDDDPIDRAIYTRIIQGAFDMSFEILEATNAKQATAILQSHQVDCILLDYQLPDMTGLELLELIRSISGDYIPVIMLTGQGSEHVAASAIKTGAADYMSKNNMDSSRLASSMKELIRRYHLKKITEEHKAHLKHHSYYDELTGLVSRHTFEKVLMNTLSNAQKFKFEFAILLVDLDNFMTVNDSFGYVAGNEVLIEVSNRLNHLLKHGDVIARLGDDEFAVLLVGHDNKHAAERTAKNILEKLRQPFQVSIDEIVITASIGIACFPEVGSDFYAILKCANIALSCAKEAGGGVYEFYQGD